jgi:Na+/proline symporter/signal transduction histidine kinase
VLSAWSVTILAVGYVGLLFAVARFGERHAARLRGGRWEPLVYALSLGVWCTPWAFYGSVGHAAGIGFGFALTYIGPALMLLAGFPVLQKIARTAKAQNVTSIADFMGARYGKSHAVAALVTLLAIVGLIPYIALQLQAVMTTFNVVATGGGRVPPGSPTSLWHDTALYVALAMTLFAVLFGLRRVHSNERHEGMIFAVAFESLVKVAAFVALGIFVTFVLFGSPGALAERVSDIPRLAAHLTSVRVQPHWITITLLASLAFICLPRQFHVTIVENGNPSNLRTAAWMLPLLLLAMAVFVPAIAAAGLLTLPRWTMAELFPLMLPIRADQPALALTVFVGGLSAATATIIVEVVALSTMICNELVVPVLVRRVAIRNGTGTDMTRLLLRTRWAAAFFVLLAAYAFHKATAHTYSLASIGIISLVAVAQFAPALFIGLYWRGAHRHGVVAGLVGGLGLWVNDMLLPSLPVNLLPWHGAARVTTLLPFKLDPLSSLVLVSLLVNVALLVVVSLLARKAESDLVQADAFVGGTRSDGARQALNPAHATSFNELRRLAERLVGAKRAEQAFAGAAERYSERDLAAHTERLLSGAVGAASANIMVQSVLRRERNPIGATQAILAEASEAILFNHDLLRTTLENVTQGIGMFDANARLAAWNRRFLEMLNVSEDSAQIGTPLAAVFTNYVGPAFDAPGPAEALTRHHRLPDGRFLELQTNPMKSGGFVLVCTDITTQIQTIEALRRREREIREANELLEQRVSARTRELTLLNEQLEDAKRAAEAANVGKTRFFAAASHDLLQPLHVARILTGALTERNRTGRTNALLGQLDHALGSVDELLQTVLDISKLDTGAVQPRLDAVELHSLLTGAAASFQPLAAKRGLNLCVVPSRLAVRTDPTLLRRILQNLICNALRYTRQGKVLVGCRRRGSRVLIEVWDTGVGIAPDQIPLIFDEFRRGSANDADTPPGLGLGLAIVDRISRMLEHPISVRSWPERGSVFSVSVPISAEQPAPQQRRAEDRPTTKLTRKLVLCVDNDPAVLVAMRTLLQGWSCEVLTASDIAGARAAIARRGALPDVVLMDYHLDGTVTGLEALETLSSHTGDRLPAILITANYTEAVRKAADEFGCPILNKPVRPGALRALLAQILSRKDDPLLRNAVNAG